MCPPVFSLRCWSCRRLWRNPSWIRNSWNTNLRCRPRLWITRWRSCELWTSTPRAPWHLRWWRYKWRSWSWKTSRWGGIEVTAKTEHIWSWCVYFSSVYLLLFSDNKILIWDLLTFCNLLLLLCQVPILISGYPTRRPCLPPSGGIVLSHVSVFCLPGGVGADTAGIYV